MALFPFSPVDAFVESNEWRTDVLRAFSDEQRIRLIDRPRRVIKQRLLLGAAQVDRAVSLLRAGLPGPFDVPEWQECQRMSIALGADTVTGIDTTTASFAVGKKAVLWTSDSLAEVLTIDAIDPTSITFTAGASRTYTNGVIAPCSDGWAPEGMSITRDASNYWRAGIDWEVFDSADLSDEGAIAATYQGDPLITTGDLVASRSFNDSLIRVISRVDNGLAAAAYDPTLAASQRAMALCFLTTTGAELWDLRVLLHTLRGRSRAFWAPSYNNGLVLDANASSGAGSIVIRSAGLSIAPATGDLFIRRRNGSTLTLRYTNATSGGVTETLTLSGTLPSALNVADVEMFCRLYRVRFDSDQFDLEHRAPRECSVIAPVIEVPL